jgi:hypothetical protein
MSQNNPSSEKPNVITHRAEEYRELYANSAQIRMSVWDFFVVFGTIRQEAAEEVQLEHLAGVYLSPQQAKALLSLLGHNVAQYERAFGPIALEPKFPQPGGPVN